MRMSHPVRRGKVCYFWERGRRAGEEARHDPISAQHPPKTAHDALIFSSSWHLGRPRWPRREGNSRLAGSCRLLLFQWWKTFEQELAPTPTSATATSSMAPRRQTQTWAARCKTCPWRWQNSEETREAAPQHTLLWLFFFSPRRRSKSTQAVLTRHAEHHRVFSEESIYFNFTRACLPEITWPRAAHTQSDDILILVWLRFEASVRPAMQSCAPIYAAHVKKFAFDFLHWTPQTNQF